MPSPAWVRRLTKLCANPVLKNSEPKHLFDRVNESDRSPLPHAFFSKVLPIRHGAKASTKGGLLAVKIPFAVTARPRRIAQAVRRLEATGRERADATGDIRAETSCLGGSRRALETCRSVAARLAVGPIPLDLPGARGGRGWAIAHLREAPKARCRRKESARSN